MPSTRVVSLEFLLWCQLFLLWAIATYGITADPLRGETANFASGRWYGVLVLRGVFVLGLSYALSRSPLLAVLFFAAVLLQPLCRYRLPMQWLAEFEVGYLAACLYSALALIRSHQLSTSWVPATILPRKSAALCVVLGTLLVVVRGGTYVVRGVLRKSGTLKPRDRAHFPDKDKASEEDFWPIIVDVEEYNRGRLIGNLERIVLTIVVAAGSYAALAFLVAAKGLVRFEEFEKSRDFTEYFLIGSLSSVLVALCAGIGLRIALIRLWPDLLTLQMQ